MSKTRKNKFYKKTIEVLKDYLKTKQNAKELVITESEDGTTIGLLWTPKDKKQKQDWFFVDTSETDHGQVIRIVLQDWGLDFLHGEAMFDPDVMGGDRDNFEENYLPKIGDGDYYYEAENAGVWSIYYKHFKQNY
jgi:hypothetical protein